jgi:hypothetical protein
MADLIYPGGSGITTVTNTGLEANDMTLMGTSIAGAAQQTDYSDVKAGIIGNPGALGGVTAATSFALAGDLKVQDPTEGSGFLTLQTVTASSGTLTGATDTIEVNIPSGAVILGCSLRVDVLVSDTGGDDTWSAEYNDGASLQAIVTGAAAAKNTKVDVLYDANADSAVMDAETDIVLTPNGGNFDGGEITAVVYYLELTSLDDV